MSDFKPRLIWESGDRTGDDIYGPGIVSSLEIAMDEPDIVDFFSAHRTKGEEGDQMTGYTYLELSTAEARELAEAILSALNE